MTVLLMLKPEYYFGWILQRTPFGWWVHDRVDSFGPIGRMFIGYEDAKDWVAQQAVLREEDDAD